MKKLRLYILLLLAALSSCQLFKAVPSDPGPGDAPDTEMTGTAQFEYWRHSPMHPSNHQPLTFSLRAFDGFGIQRVELYLYEFELYKDGDGLPSKRRQPGGHWGLLKSWEMTMPVDSVELSYAYEKGFAARSNVEYQFRITNGEGGQSERLAIFDAGDSPWPEDKILLYATSREYLKNTINICFFPDTDFERQWNRFLSETEQLIYNGYHASNMIEHNKMLWNFFYTKHEADGLLISSDFNNPAYYPPFMKDSIIEGIDAFALLHSSTYADGSYMYGNIHFLAHDVFTSESYNWGTAVHETAHAVFGLSDEYEGCACFEGPAGANVFESLSACRAFNTAHGFNPDDCSVLINYEGREWYMSERNVMFDTEDTCHAFNRRNGYSAESCQLFIDVDGRNFYRSEEGLCIMQDDGDRIVRKFQPTCAVLIQKFYERLDTRQAFLPDRSDQNNYYGYEPIVAMELEVDKQDWTLEVQKVRYGVPDKNFKNGEQLDINITDKKGDMVYNARVDSPEFVRIHGSSNGDRIIDRGKGRCIIEVPYRKNMQKASCTSRGEIHSLLGLEKLKFKK